ncbi:hypothetical protein ACMD2_27330 [Ananas comosus]|uniref:DUF7792 domain-containing protein n=1 Tax=Ananas comosus TaxID=4615 RepID=A0A199UYG7_ANACO|nr:hypothetical protein ACMD2_27330 [Ananas comosus]
MGDGVKSMLAKPIHLAEQVRKLAGDAQSSRPECAELQVRAERLAALLRQAARQSCTAASPRASSTRRRRPREGLASSRSAAAATTSSAASSPSPANALPACPPARQLHRRRLLAPPHLLASGRRRRPPRLPNIARDEPMLCLIWSTSRASTRLVRRPRRLRAQLASLARDSDHFAKLIIEEDGVGPSSASQGGLRRGQESAARALGYLGRDPESVEHLVHAGACSAFAQVLKDAPFGPGRGRVAVAELAAHHPGVPGRLLPAQRRPPPRRPPRQRDAAGAQQILRRRPSKPCPPLRRLAHTKSIRAANQHQISQPSQHQNQHQNHNQIHSVVQSAIAAKSTNGVGAATALKSYNNLGPGPSKGRREAEDPETKAYLKAMAANALWRLAQGNISICQSITESRALLCFAVLLEKGVGRVRYYSAMALMEIARVAEHNVMLRQSAFKPSSPTAKAVVDQLLRIVWNGVYDELLQPSITALGCLSRTFQASETRIIGPLVALLDESEAAVSKEAVIALTKFACSENHLHVNHCKAVIDAGGARHLVQLVYLGEQVQIEALILLCYIALHVPDSEELAQAGVLAVLLWASKQAHMVQDSRVESLLPEAKARMELFQSRESR